MVSYRDIADELGERILTGELGPGEKLPGIRQLGERYRVNKRTAGEAVRELKRQGFVRTGPQGTVVCVDLAAATPADRLRRQLSGRSPLRPGEHVTMVDCGWAYAYEPYLREVVWDTLELPPGSRVGIRESIVHYGGRRICLMVSWHPAAMCDLVPSLVDPEPIPEGTIGAVMAAGTRYGDQDQHLVARGASKREAGLLQIEHETPVLAVVSLRVSSDDTPIEYLECVYAPGVVLSV